MGRGGRILLDRASTSYDDVWSRLDYTIFDSEAATQTTTITNEESRLTDVKHLDSGISVVERQQSTDECFDKVSQPILHLQQHNHHNNNHVIKSENSKSQETSDDQTNNKVLSHGEKLVNNQKLDDFEQLLDSASASSNIINKKLVCRNNSDISDDSFMVVKVSASELLTKNSSVGGLLNSFSGGEASSSGVSSTNGSLSFALGGVQSSSQQEVVPIERIDEDEIKSECSTSQEDFYASLFDEIKTDWLHFRPKTPTSPSSLIFDSDLTDSTKKFAVELQMLDDGFNETETNRYVDNVYLSQQMSFNFSNNHIQLNDDAMETNVVNVKTEPADDFMDESNVSMKEPEMLEQDAVKRLLEKYQNDVANDDSLAIDVDDLNFDEFVSSSVGCSNFKLYNEDLVNSLKTKSESCKSVEIAAIKSEISEFSSTMPRNPVQNVAIVQKEAPIAELQSHNYVLQYGSPVTTNSVTMNSIPGNANIVTMDSGISPATTLFQQQFINSGNTIISQQSQNKLQNIVYDSNTIVLAAAPGARKQLNGPTDRTCKKLKLNFYFQIF
jgi:hypothetical protein